MDDKTYISIIASLFGAVVGLGVYLWTRTVSQYDCKISDLEKGQKEHESRLSHLEGEHKVNVCKKVKE